MQEGDVERQAWRERVECRACAYSALSVALTIFMFVWAVLFIGIPLGAISCNSWMDTYKYEQANVHELREISRCVAVCCDDEAPTHPVECMERYNCVHACISPLLHDHPFTSTEFASRNVSAHNNSELYSL